MSRLQNFTPSPATEEKVKLMKNITSGASDRKRIVFFDASGAEVPRCGDRQDRRHDPSEKQHMEGRRDLRSSKPASPFAAALQYTGREAPGAGRKPPAGRLRKAWELAAK
jgi:hypothetical protein